LIKGATSQNAQGKFTQLMVQSQNIDQEFTLSGAIKLAIFIPIYVGIFYYFK